MTFPSNNFPQKLYRTFFNKTFRELTQLHKAVAIYLFYIKRRKIKAKQNTYGGKTKHFQDVAWGWWVPRGVGGGHVLGNILPT